MLSFLDSSMSPSERIQSSKSLLGKWKVTDVKSTVSILSTKSLRLSAITPAGLSMP